MRETCPKSEYLEIDPGVSKLAADVLAEKEIAEADKLSEDITSSRKKKRLAIEVLQEKVGTKPKRPMFYLNDELGYLPYHTRDAMRDFGDYIDHLIKFCSADNLRNKKYEEKSLGSNLINLKGAISEKLRLRLIQFNKLVYVPAKHDFDVKIRRHRFTSKEVVFVCFITMALAKQIVKISARARDYAEDRIYV
ncbi:MAG: hypothetical protein PHE24_03315 [Patescibacteria group bacterium]|nr:hypothetical protein [Patescibacteria group bacterium]